MKIEGQTREELDKIRKEIEVMTNQPKTDDQVIKELIDFWKRSRKHITGPNSTTKTITSKSDLASIGTRDPYFTFLKEDQHKYDKE